MSKRILITGVGGFIGSHLCKMILNKYPSYRVYGLDSLSYAGKTSNFEKCFSNNKFTFIKGDIRNKGLLYSIFENFKITDVIHLAAESHVDNSINGPEVFIETNICGTSNLLECARKYWKGSYNKHRFHHVSTDEVYGSLELNSDEKFTELTPYNPHSPYSASKASSDHLVRAYHDTYGMNVTISNCSNNYGTHQHEEKLIPHIISCIVNNKTIPVYGDGKNVRDWLSVTDHCRAIDLIFHKGKSGESYNVGGNNEWSNIKLIEKICNIADKILERDKRSIELIKFVKDRSGHDKRYAIDATKIYNELKWKPTTSFSLNLYNVVNWYINKFTCKIIE